MLWTTSVILFVFWLLGMSQSFTAGGYIHVLLGVSLAVVAIQYVRDRIDLLREKQKYKEHSIYKDEKRINRGPNNSTSGLPIEGIWQRRFRWY